MNSHLQDLEAELSKAIRGEVRFDAYSKVLYSTDASIYQIEPIGVVIPRDRDDVAAAVGLAMKYGLPVLPRGGGTSLSGQTVGQAIQIDFAKYMHRVLELNKEEHWVRVQPGLVQDQLNAYLRPHGFGFGPDTSSSNRATLGGMCGNNSAGSHSVVYGKTIDHTIELDVVLSDGSEARFGAVTPDRLDQLARGDRLENRLYREVRELGAAYAEEIRARYPKIIRRVSGYNLDEFVPNGGGLFGAGLATPPGPFNLAKVVVGSEGTLAVASEARMKIVPLPKKKALEVVLFHDLVDAVEATREMMETHPAATELMDKLILDRARQHPDFAPRMGFAQGDNVGALLVVEFFGDTDEEVRSGVEELDARLKHKRIGFGHLPVVDLAKQQSIWKVRKDSLGLLMSVPGDRKPIAFVEDPAVPVERLPEFLRRFRQILTDHQTTGGYYGHASVGCVHIRPLIDLKQQSEVDKMRHISEEVFQLVVECGGSMSGEHGDGLARGHFNERLFGPKVYEGFQKLKAAFDPRNLMNPGKVVQCPDMTRDLRYGASYQTVQIQTHLDFSKEGGFAGAVEACNGMGICRKQTEGTMCPSYQATLEEEHSTRGRANALRAALSGRLPAEEFTSHRMYETLDLCLECKGCKGECPSKVDLAKMKYEFLAHYYKRHGVPLRSRVFANIATLNRWGSRAAPLANYFMSRGWVKSLVELTLGIDSRRDFPPFAPETFQTWFRQRRTTTASERKVVLFDDCFLSHNYPQVGRAATELLEKAGFQVVLARQECCGRPMISKGLLEDACRVARRNVRVLAPLVKQGAVIVGCEPSCLLTLRDEYLDLLHGPEVEQVAQHSYLFEEFRGTLHDAGKLELTFREQKRRVLVHGHCHQKAHIGTGSTLRALRLVPGYEVTEINSGCCGMAGSFGFEKEHYDISRTISGQRLVPAVNAAPPDAEIVITGVSCRQQIGHFTSRTPRHAVELLREAVEP